MDSTPIDTMFERQPITDPSIRKYEISRFPSQQIMAGAGAPNLSEITIDARSAGMDSLIMLQRAWIGVRCRVYADVNHTALTGNKQQLIQNGWNLFSRASLYISDSEVEQVDRPGVVSHFKRLVEWTDDAIKGQGPATSYYPYATDLAETLSITDSTNPVDPLLQKGVRRYRTGVSQYIKLPLRDVFGFCNVDKGLLGAGVKLRLQPEQNKERILLCSVAASGSNAEFVRIEAVDLYLPVARPDNATLANIYKEVKSGKTIPYEFERWNHITNALTTTAENMVLPNFSKRPTSVFIGMQLDSQQGTFTGDSLTFNLFGLSSHRLMMDSKVYPEISYEGSAQGYLHEYETFLQIGNKHRTDAFGTFVDFDKWRNLYPLIGYDISAVRDEFGAVRSNPPVIRWTATHTNPGAAATAHIIVVGKEVRDLHVVNDIMLVSAPDFSD